MENCFASLAVAPLIDENPSEDIPLLIIVVVCVVGILLLALNIILILFFVRRRRQKLEKGQKVTKCL